MIAASTAITWLDGQRVRFSLRNDLLELKAPHPAEGCRDMAAEFALDGLSGQEVSRPLESVAPCKVPHIPRRAIRCTSYTQ